MPFLDDTLIASTHDILSDRMKHLHVPRNKLNAELNHAKVYVKEASKEMSGYLKRHIAYPFPIRETTPKEVGTRSANSIFDCISDNSSYKHRKQKT